MSRTKPVLSTSRFPVLSTSLHGSLFQCSVHSCMAHCSSAQYILAWLTVPVLSTFLHGSLFQCSVNSCMGHCQKKSQITLMLVLKQSELCFCNRNVTATLKNTSEFCCRFCLLILVYFSVKIMKVLKYFFLCNGVQCNGFQLVTEVF